MKSCRILFAILLAGFAFAQSAPTTSLSGTVADASGAVVPHAALELTNTATHWSRKTTSDDAGRFLFTLVSPGIYDLQAAAQGFTPLRQEGIRLDADVPATLHIALSIATSASTIAIKEDAPMVDAQSGAVRQVVGEQYIEDLPLQGRNAAALVYMAPGTVLGKGIDSGAYATKSDTIAVSANGAMGDQVSYKLDGSSHTDNLNNLNAGFPNPDALSQFLPSQSKSSLVPAIGTIPSMQRPMADHLGEPEHNRSSLRPQSPSGCRWRWLGAVRASHSHAGRGCSGASGIPNHQHQAASQMRGDRNRSERRHPARPPVNGGGWKHASRRQ